MKWKFLSYAALALIVVTAIWWFKDGMHIFTEKERIITVDPLFGSKTETYGDTYMLGLDIAGPVCGALAIAAAAGLYLDRKKRTTQLPS